MSKILLDINIKYETMNKSEKKIADLIMGNPSQILPLNITQLSKLCNTSQASIVRFSKKLGFSGYHQLKIAIAQEADLRPISDRISEDDSAFGMFEKICDDIYCSLEKTKKTIDTDAFKNCCTAILNANKILIFGLGNSSSVAIDAAHKLFRLGLNATSYTDNHMQTIAAAHSSPQCVIIGISHSGHSKDIIESMRIAKNNGATTIALTNQNKSPIDEVSDILLKTASSETNYRILGLCSRITQLAIIDAIYSFLVCNIPNAEEKIDKTELVLQTKKI